MPGESPSIVSYKRWQGSPYGENNYSLVAVKNLDELAENKCDTARASSSEDMYHKYNLALADLRNDRA